MKTVSTLLIGSGNGNLDVEMAVACTLEGLEDAMQGGFANSSVRRIRIVEWELRKAQRVLEALVAQRAKVPAGIRLVEDLQQGPGGAIGEEIAMSAILLATAWREMGSGAEGAAKKAAKQVLQGVTATPALRESCEKVLQSLGGTPRGDVLSQAGRLNLGRRPSIGSSSGLPPTRTSFPSLSRRSRTHSATAPARCCSSLEKCRKTCRTKIVSLVASWKFARPFRKPRIWA